MAAALDVAAEPERWRSVIYDAAPAAPEGGNLPPYTDAVWLQTFAGFDALLNHARQGHDEALKAKREKAVVRAFCVEHDIAWPVGISVAHAIIYAKSSIRAWAAPAPVTDSDSHDLLLAAFGEPVQEPLVVQRRYPVLISAPARIDFNLDPSKLRSARLPNVSTVYDLFPADDGRGDMQGWLLSAADFKECLDLAKDVRVAGFEADQEDKARIPAYICDSSEAASNCNTMRAIIVFLVNALMVLIPSRLAYDRMDASTLASLEFAFDLLFSHWTHLNDHRLANKFKVSVSKLRHQESAAVMSQVKDIRKQEKLVAPNTSSTRRSRRRGGKNNSGKTNNPNSHGKVPAQGGAGKNH